MDMDIDFFVEIRPQAEKIGARPHVGKSGLRGFSHHFAELAGGADLAGAGHEGGFHKQEFAAEFRKGEACADADLRIVLAFPVPVLFDAKELRQVLAGDDDLFFQIIGDHDLHGGFAADGGDFAL